MFKYNNEFNYGMEYPRNMQNMNQAYLYNQYFNNPYNNYFNNKYYLRNNNPWNFNNPYLNLQNTYQDYNILGTKKQIIDNKTKNYIIENKNMIWNPDYDLLHRSLSRQYLIPREYRARALDSNYMKNILLKYLKNPDLSIIQKNVDQRSNMPTITNKTLNNYLLKRSKISKNSKLMKFDKIVKDLLLKTLKNIQSKKNNL